jgi:hypothetical protein
MVSPRSVLSVVEEWELAFGEGRQHDVIASVASLFPDMHYGTAQSGVDQMRKVRL